jgi:hypothetical protein
MYTPDDREGVRTDLIAAARTDPRIVGAALTGSASVGREDRWSDIDLAFGIIDESQIPSALDDWTARMYAEHAAVHHTDVRSGTWLYRVFLLENSLQVDLAFAPQADFAAKAPTFKLLFGTAVERAYALPRAPDDLIGLAWLYALHVRSALARGKLWQAEYMISAARDSVLAVACRRLGLPAAEGRGLDQLPAEATEPMRAALVARLDAEEIARAFGVVIDRLIAEVRDADAALASRLEPALRDLLSSTRAAVSR